MGRYLSKKIMGQPSSPPEIHPRTDAQEHSAVALIGSRLFRRLFMATVPGLIAVIVVGGLALAAFLTLAAYWNDQAGSFVATTTYLFHWGPWGIGFLVLLAVLASLLTATMLTRNTMRPIARLKRSMARVAAGDLAPPAYLGPEGDELE